MSLNGGHTEDQGTRSHLVSSGRQGGAELCFAQTNTGNTGPWDLGVLCFLGPIQGSGAAGSTMVAEEHVPRGLSPCLP